MSPSIHKISSYKNAENIVVLVRDEKNKFDLLDFSKTELDYIKTQLTINKKNRVSINRYNKWIFVQKIDEKKEKHISIEFARRAGSELQAIINELKIESIVIADLINNADVSLAVAEGMALSNYQFLNFKQKKEEGKNSLKTINVLSKVSSEDINQLNILNAAVYEARNLVNTPFSHLNSVDLSKEVARLGKESGFKVEVLNKAKIEALKMGGLLAVNKGSAIPPTFSIIEWNPKGSKNKKPYVLVGKGVVYDTGGISLKTAAGLETMKCDMGGAAAVACTLFAIAKAKLPIHVIGLIPATDNFPDANAYVPGDIVTMHNGVTVEVLNTDAEGRMILGDALSYAQKYNPELVIDLATLTGSAVATTGQYATIAMGLKHEEHFQKLKTSGDNSYERLAELPFYDEYDDLIKSDVAEIKNIGGPVAGAITAGKFLAYFTNYPWIHLDIAGPAFINKKEHYNTKGATGVGVRMLFDFFKNI